MLRDFRSPFLAPRLAAYKYNVNGTTKTQSLGVGSASVVANGTGVSTVTWGRPFGRTAVTVVSPNNDVAAGSYAYNVSPFSSVTGTKVNTVDRTLTQSNGTVNGITLGWDQRDATRYTRRANVVRGDFDQTGIVALQVNTSGSGSVTINKRAVFSLTRNGTGDVTIVLRRAFATANITGAATCVGSSPLSCTLSCSGADTFRLRGFTANSTTPADGIFNVIIVGDLQGVGERTASTPVMSDQRKPILFGYHVTTTAGTQTLAIGTGDVTITKPNTGRCALTFTQAFAREAIVVACASFEASGQVVLANVDVSSSTGFEVKVYNASASLTDPVAGGGFSVIGVGFDDATEY